MAIRAIEENEYQSRPEAHALPIYNWLGIAQPEFDSEQSELEQSESRPEITAESFKVQTNPKALVEQQEREYAEDRAEREARFQARLAQEQETEPSVADNSHEKTFARVYGLKPLTELETEPLVDKLTEPLDNETQIEVLEQTNSELEKQRFSFSFGQLARDGLRRAVELTSSTHAPEIDVKKYAKIAIAPLNLTKGGVQEKYEKAKEWASDEEHRKKIKKSALAIGGIALTVVGVAYIEHKGLPAVHSSHSAQEAINQPTPKSLRVPNEFTVPLHVQAVTAQAAHHVHNAKEALNGARGALTVNLKNGYGYTQVLQKAFKGHSSLEYYRAYREGIKHFGAGFIKHVSHYREANGDFGLKGGSGTKVEIPANEVHFFMNFFKSNR